MIPASVRRITSSRSSIASASEYNLQERDQLWLLMDRDLQSWKPAMISAIAQQCQSKGYFLAVSPPCFEIWLLLHFEDVPNQADARKQELAGNADGLLKSEVGQHAAPRVVRTSTISSPIPRRRLLVPS